MFDISNFKYDEQSHMGFYRGVRVPSVTQLLEVLFPLGNDIPIDRLENAAKRGTAIHDKLESVNKLISEKHIVPSGCLTDQEEVNDYLGLLEAYHLRPLKYEEMVFLLDENGELLTFGTLDLIVGAYKDIEPFKESETYVCDFKTVSVFDKQKTAYQTAIYRVAFKQTFNLETNKQTFGIWLREGVKLIPLKTFEDDYIINLCKTLVGAWKQL